MKYCKNCWEEIPDDCKICPYCKKKPDMNYNNISIKSIIFVIVILLLVGMSSFYCIKHFNIDLSSLFKFSSSKTTPSTSKTSSETKSGTLTCTKNYQDEDGYNIEDTITVTYKDDIVTKVAQTNISEMDKNVLEMSYALSQSLADAFNEIDGFDAEYTKLSDTSLKYTVTVDFNKLDVEALTELFGEDIDTSYYTQSNTSLSDFKKNNLNEYECK